MNLLDAIRARRSVGRLKEPAPDDAELRTILEAAACAPDHEELRPWRFVVLRGEHKDAFGQVLHDTYMERCRSQGVEPTQGQRTKERTKLGRAPLVVVAGAVRRESPTVPWIEQQLAVGAAVQNALLACTALGYASMWRTGDPAYDPAVKRALGFADDDSIVGFLYMGTPEPSSAKPPHDPELTADTVTEWSPDTSASPSSS